MPETLVPAKLFDLVPGSRFQNYTLLERIGVGGQGVVWSAFDPVQKQVIAIKFNEVLETEQGLIDDQLMERQANVLLSLHHPHILPILKIGHSGKLRYIISPYIEGGTLELKQVIPLDEKFRIISEICSALDYLHSQNVIHRDVKPANVLMDFQRRSYLSDFGLARILTGTTQALHTGHATPPYASPEQLAYKQITLKSDLYSLGVMLYEIFTHQLPWKGEQELGMRQLYTQDEIPDPCEIDPKLPKDLVILLRRITCADPKKRPASAGEILEMLTDAFGSKPILIEKQAPPEEATEHRKNNANLLLRKKYIEWNKSPDVVPISLTHFAVVDQYMQENAPRPIPGNLQIFMLQAALTYGYRDREWWNQTGSINDRLGVALNLIDPRKPAVGRRVLQAMTMDPQVIDAGRKMSAEISSRLLDLAGTTSDPALQKTALQTLRRLTTPASAWRENALPPGEDYRLAILAVLDSEQGDEAARLIGHLRSASAVATAFSEADPSRRSALLLEVQKVAGDLPQTIPAPTRFRTTLDWILMRLSIQPMTILSAYVVIFLGALLGFGIPVYLIYRLPNFMDLTRIIISLERGAFMGIPLGFGILLTRLLVERLGKIRLGYRLGLATAAGWLVIATSFILYDLLILKNFSFSPGMILGSLLIALGYAACGMLTRSWLRFLISLAAVVTALAGSWWLYLYLRTLGIIVAPIVYFDTTWSAIQVLGTILLASLPLAILGNLIRLVPRED
jgi:serine/threonine protein kinase